MFSAVAALDLLPFGYRSRMNVQPLRLSTWVILFGVAKITVQFGSIAWALAVGAWSIPFLWMYRGDLQVAVRTPPGGWAR